MLARAKAALQKMNRQNSSVMDSSYDGLALTREDLLPAHSIDFLDMAVLPILDKKTIIGVLEVLSEKAHAFNASHIQWLKDVTELVRTVCVRESAPTPRITPAPPAGSDQPTNDKESKPVPDNDSFQE